MEVGTTMIALFLCQCCAVNGNGHAVLGPNSDKEIEEISFKSIKAIHKHLDDDQDGTVNLQESNEFMVDELKLDDKKRHSSFHNNDSLISVEDLWNSWKRSEVHNWTNKDVLSWLTDIVGLPQYKSSFSKYKIDGRILPRFTNESSTLYADLGINNPKHRKKIYLLATDIVLFGLPSRDYTKDMILATIVVLMTLACLYSFNERIYAKRQMEQMLKDVECMQQAEENLKSTQRKLMEAEKEHVKTERSKREIEEKLKEEIESAKKEAERLHEQQSHHKEERIKLSLVEQELSEVRKALQKAEAEMEAMQPKSSKALQQWLMITYKKESKHFSLKKSKALKQMEDAKDACDKIHKKRSSVFGPLRLVHSQTIDEVDQKILQARNALAEVTNDLQERQHRWRQIEELCGFPIAFDGHLGHIPEVNENVRRSSIAGALAICANLGGIGSLPDMNQQLVSDSSHEHVKYLLDSHTSTRSESDYKICAKRSSAFDVISSSGRASPVNSLTRVSSKCSSKSEQVFRSFDERDNIVDECISQHGDFRDSNVADTKISSRKSGQRVFPASSSTPAFSAIHHSPHRSFSLRQTDSVDSQESLNKADSSFSNENALARRQDSSRDMLSFEVFSSEENLAVEKNINQSSSSSDLGKLAVSAEESVSRSPEIKKNTPKKVKKPASFDHVSLKNTDSPECVKKRSIFSKLKKK